MGMHASGAGQMTLSSLNDETVAVDVQIEGQLSARANLPANFSALRDLVITTEALHHRRRICIMSIWSKCIAIFDHITPLPSEAFL